MTQDDLAELLVAQARTLQGTTLTPERARELARVVGPLNDAVAEGAPALPYDVDATTFYGVLEACADGFPPPSNGGDR